MDDIEILHKIHDLISQEHTLRQQGQSGEVDRIDERAQLQRLDETLDQCWDLLRQRRARKEFGQDVDGAAVRPVDEVEHYLQ